MVNGFNDPTFNDTLKSTLKSLSQSKQGNDTVNSLFSNLNSQYPNTNYSDYHSQQDMLPNMSSDNPQINIDRFQNHNGDQSVPVTLKMLAEAQSGLEGYEATAIEDTGEHMMEEMMKQFEELGE
jgi:hypothetical protein